MKAFLHLVILVGAVSVPAEAFDLFARGSLSKNAISKDNYIVSLNTNAGFAFTLFGGVRIDARYTNASSLQNKLSLESGSLTATLTDIKTETQIVSLGLDLNLLGDKYAFQPFLYFGAGYLMTERSYYLAVGSGSNEFRKEPKTTGFSGNLGAGFRLRVTRSMAFECEAFAYGLDIHKPNPLINLMGTLGIRLMI